MFGTSIYWNTVLDTFLRDGILSSADYDSRQVSGGVIRVDFTRDFLNALCKGQELASPSQRGVTANVPGVSLGVRTRASVCPYLHRLNNRVIGPFSKARSIERMFICISQCGLHGKYGILSEMDCKCGRMTTATRTASSTITIQKYNSSSMNHR